MGWGMGRRDARQIRKPLLEPQDVGDRVLREIAAVVARHPGGDAGEQHACAATDLEHLSGLESKDAVHCCLHPGLHVLRGDGGTCEAAGPAAQVKGWIVTSGAGQALAVQPLPLGHPLPLQFSVTILDPLADVSQQALATRPPVGGHHRLPHPRQRTQHVFHFREFDAVTANLHLLIDTTQKLKLGQFRAIHPPSNPVAGAIQPAGTEGIGDELCGIELWPPQIAAGHAHTPQMQLAGHPGWRQLTSAVEHVGAQIVDRTADRCRSTVRHAVADRGGDRHLRGAVDIEESAVPSPTLHQLGGDHVAPGSHNPQVGKPDLRKGVEHRRRHHRMGDAFRPQALHQGVAEHIRPPRQQVGGASGAEHHQQMGERGVEVEGGEMGEAAAGPGLQQADVGFDGVDQGAVLHQNAVRSTGGSRCVHHVGQVAGIQSNGESLPIVPPPRSCLRDLVQPIQRDPRQGLSPRQGSHRSFTDYQGQARVLHHQPQASVRMVWIEGQKGPAGLKNSQHGDDLTGGAVEEEANYTLRPDTPLTEMGRQGVRLPFQVAIGDLHTTDSGIAMVDDGQAVGGSIGPILEEMMDAAIGGKRRVRSAEALQDVFSLIGRQRIDGADRPPGIFRQLPQNAHQMGAHAPNRLSLV